MGTKRTGAACLRSFPAKNQRRHQTANLVGCLMMILSSLLAGCTTLKPMAENAEILRNELRGGEVVELGDKVCVVTRDGLSRLLIVTELNHNTMKGHPEGVETESLVVTIPFDDIVYMEGKQISVGKTAAYSGGIGVGAVAALFIAVMIALATMF
jgi:hypothetical protein